MKLFLFILACVISYFPVFAQSYQYSPIPTVNAVWKGTNEQYHIKGHGCAKYQFTVTGTSTVTGTDTFYRIDVQGAEATSSIPDHSTSEQKEFYNTCTSNKPFEFPIEAHSPPVVRWMIERHKKIYILNSPALDTSVHPAALDFNIDSVGQRVFMGMGAYQDSVVQIDTININGTLRKRFALRNAALQSIDTIIEGIGSLRFGLGFDLLQQAGTAGKGQGKVFCFSVNGQQEYVYNNSACADIWPLKVDNILKDTRFIFGPNPFSYQLTCNAPSDATVRIYNVLGACVSTHTCNRGEKIVIETSAWQPGVYIAITESKGSRNASRLVKL